MRTILLLALIAACSKSDKPATPAASPVAGSTAPAAGAPTPVAPAPTPAPAPTAAAPAAAAPDDVTTHTVAFMNAFADAVVAAGDDCEKLATSLDALASQAKSLHDEFEKTHKKLSDIPPDPAFAQKMGSMKDPELLDKCEKSSPHAKKAIDESIGAIISPADDPELVKAFGDALGAATAVH